MFHKLCHWNTWSYASRPNFCLNDDKSGKARHGNFAPSCVTIESNPYLVSLFDFIIATLLHNRDVKRKQSIIRIIPKTFKHCSVNQVFQYLLPCNCIKHGNFFSKRSFGVFAVQIPVQQDASHGWSISWVNNINCGDKKLQAPIVKLIKIKSFW